MLYINDSIINGNTRTIRMLLKMGRALQMTKDTIKHDDTVIAQYTRAINKVNKYLVQEGYQGELL